MSKYVYLFELDSVRKTDEEIIAGQAALYDEIVTNGNIVVLTYNQMVDSRGFFSLLKNGEYKEALLKLFDSGVIKISQYGDIRTVSQYLMDSIEDDKQFIYSALPLKYSQKRLTAIIFWALFNAFNTIIGVFTSVFTPPYVSIFITSSQPIDFSNSLYTILVFTVCPFNKSNVSAKHPMIHTFFTNFPPNFHHYSLQLMFSFIILAGTPPYNTFSLSIVFVNNAPYATTEFFLIQTPFNTVAYAHTHT